MKNGPFERDTCDDEQASAIEDIDNIGVIAAKIAEFAALAKSALEHGDPETAMRYVQRARYLCQMRADFVHLRQ
jgi:hypothetical protein